MRKQNKIKIKNSSNDNTSTPTDPIIDPEPELQPYTSMPTQSLDWKWLWTDDGTDTSNDLTIWRPINPFSNDYKSIGDYVVDRTQSDKLENYPDGGEVKFVLDKPEYSAKPTGYERVWYNKKGKYEGSIWKPTCPTGYESLGYVGQIGKTEPSSNDIRCVKTNLLVPSRYSSNELWDMKAQNIENEVGVWSVYDSHTFKASNDTNAEPLDAVWTLK